MKGDLYRILKRKSLYLVLALAVMYDIFSCIYTFSTKLITGFSYTHDQLANVRMIAVAFGLIIFLTVYADEFRSMAMTHAIGRGISRGKVILTKFLNSLFASVLLFSLLTVVILVFTAIMWLTGLEFSFDELKALFLRIFIEEYQAVGYITFSAIIIYMTRNAAVSFISYFVFSLLIPLILLFAEETAFMEYVPVNRFYFTALADEIYTDLMFGFTGHAFILFMLCTLVYFGGALVIIYAAFKNKELDF